MAIITIKELQALKAVDDGRRISMGGSMYGTVRVGVDGVSVYVVWRYMAEGKRREIRLGTWRDKGGQSLKALRDKRDILAAEVKTRVDPIDRRASAKLKQDNDKIAAKLQAQADADEAIRVQKLRLADQAAMRARMTVRAMFERWQNLDLRNRVDKGAESLRSFEADVFPSIGDMAAEDVRKAHIQAILDSIRARATDDKPMVRTLKKTLGDLRQMFHWALERDYLNADPTAVISKGKLGQNVERDRFLSEDEIIELFQKLPIAGLTETSRLALMIQLATAARIGEVLQAHWAHVDMDRQTWTIPAVMAKNGKAHTIALSDFAMQQFHTLHFITGTTTWMFPSSSIGKPVDMKAVTKQVADRQRLDKPRLTGRTKQVDALILAGGKWTPHDLRRTAATTMAALGVLDNVVDKCLNHVEPIKVRRTYNRFTYEALMREAWQLLGDRLELLHRQSMGESSNVILLQAA